MAEYIERDAVISDLEAAEKHGGMGMIIANTLKQYVKRVPAADVAPVVHGRWEDDVYTDPYGGKWTKYRCSLCGRIEVVKEPYCSCGAKMDLEG